MIAASDLSHKVNEAGTRPMCVLHLAAGNLYGGIETVLLSLAAERGKCPELEQRFLTCFNGRLSDELKAAGASVSALGAVRWSRPLSILRAQLTLARELRAARPDIAICHGTWVHSVLGGVIRRAGVRLVYFQHSGHARRTWVDLLAARARPDLCIANSAYTAATTHRAFRGAKVSVWHPPLRLASARAERSAVRARIGTGEERRVIIQVSRLEPWKGQRRHLEALARLKTGVPWEAWLVGGPQRPSEQRYERELQELARVLGLSDHVRFLGQRSDVPDLLAAADIFCQPNEAPEPYGMVFLEALRAGLPVITSASGGALEIVDSTCGVLVRAGLEPLVEALASLLEDGPRRAAMSAAGPARARAIASADTQIPLLAATLRRSLLSDVTLNPHRGGRTEGRER